MAFPVMETADVQHGVVTSNSTTWTLTYPTNLVRGDLLIAVMGRDGANVTAGTWPAGWQNTGTSNQGACSAIFAVKKSDGTETGTFNVTGLASEQGGWRVMRITNWLGDLSGTTNNNLQDNNGVKLTANTGASINPDPPSLTPNITGWSAEDVLWICAAAVDTSRTFSAWPSSYSPGDNTWDDVSGGAGGASLSVQYRQLNASTEDPGTWTISTSDDWVTVTWAVRPAAAVAAVFTRKEFPALQAVNRASVY
jgi:hypothetical protein